MNISKDREKNKVNGANSRAKECGLPATLTLEQWLKTLETFDFSCAYCGGPYEVLEHFIPLKCGNEGTILTNCFPACDPCNRRKGTIDPYDYGDLLAHLFDEARIAKVVHHIQSNHLLVHPDEAWCYDAPTSFPMLVNGIWQ